MLKQAPTHLSIQKLVLHEKLEPLPPLFPSYCPTILYGQSFEWSKNWGLFTGNFFYTFYFFNVRKWEIKFKIKRQSVVFWKKWNPSLHPRHPLPPEFWMVEILRSLTAKKRQLVFNFISVFNRPKNMGNQEALINQKSVFLWWKIHLELCLLATRPLPSICISPALIRV